MEQPTTLQAGPIPEAGLPSFYTLSEAAGYLVVREDDLTALLPDTIVGADFRLLRVFTSADVEVLEQFIRDIRKFAAESVYGGGDL